MTTGADRSAPAFAEGTVEIDAPRERVWAVLTDFANWPKWQAEVGKVTVDGEPAPGMKFKWKTGSGSIRSTIVDFEVPGAVTWSGTTLGINAMHAWQLTEADGVTTVSTQESWKGIVVRLMRRSLAPALQRAIDTGLLELKAAVEHPAAPAPAD
ncbi:MAG: SRPBCC family protein [Acidimicrobiia bacterium]